MSKTGRPVKEVCSIQQRFTVPSEDIPVLNWVKKQYNLSGSIRALIKDAIIKYGYRDYTCIGEVIPNSLAESARVSEHSVSVAAVQPQNSVGTEPVNTGSAVNSPPPVNVQSQAPVMYTEPVSQAQYIPNPNPNTAFASGGANAADALQSMLS